MALTKQKSESVLHRRGAGEKKDERVASTRKRIDAAFVELIHRRAYGNIRVSDIVKKAGVGRATFYAHFASKDDLLRSQFERIVAPMLAIKRDDPCLLDASALLVHVQSAPRVYRALLGGPEVGSAPRILRECFEKRVRESLGLRDGFRHSSDAGFEMQKAIITQSVASSLLAAIECWVESKMSSPPQVVQAIFSRMVGGGLGLLTDSKRNGDGAPPPTAIRVSEERREGPNRRLLQRSALTE